MLPSHIKHNKAMMWTHIVLFNLFCFLGAVLVIENLIILEEKKGEKILNFTFSSFMLIGILVQFLITKVIVGFS